MQSADSSKRFRVGACNSHRDRRRESKGGRTKEITAPGPTFSRVDSHKASAPAVRQITETGQADLGDRKMLLASELELIHQRETHVVLVQLGPVVSRKQIEDANRLTGSIKFHITQIDIFVLEPNAPMLSYRIL